MGRIIFQTQTRENARFKLDIHTILLSGKEEQKERNIKGGFLRLITKSTTTNSILYPKENRICNKIIPCSIVVR